MKAVQVIFSIGLLSISTLVILSTSWRQIVLGGAVNAVPRVTSKHDAESSRRRIEFIPFPHRTLGSGNDVACTWHIRVIKQSTAQEFDAIQLAAFSEGMCVPEDKSLRERLHVFSSADAIECLSSSVQQQNVSVVIAGDSYNMQLFIGLADILLGRANNEEIANYRVRRKKLNETVAALDDRRLRDSAFPKLSWVCFPDCYGSRPLLESCLPCINSYTENKTHVAAVVGTAVHVSERNRGSVNATVEEIKEFLDKANHAIFNSMPSFPQYNYTNNSRFPGMTKIYLGILPFVASTNEGHPFIDLFPLTRSCVMDNCSVDGGHRTRFVNRWKAQLLLNTICDVSNGPRLIDYEDELLVEEDKDPNEGNNETSSDESMVAVEQQQQSSAIAKTPERTGKKRMHFIPFPHRTLGSGIDVACTWHIRVVKQKSTAQELDAIQLAAFSEGMCVPEDKSLRERLYVFSSADAIECLSSSVQQENVSVVITGDSYNKQLFIGLADILLGRVSNEEIANSRERIRFLNETVSALDDRHVHDPAFPNLLWVCEPDCYGKVHLSESCLPCINSYTENKTHVAAVVGAGIHVRKRAGGSLNGTVKEIKEFLDKANRVIFNSMPSVDTEKVPPQYRNDSSFTGIAKVYLGILPFVASANEDHPFIDFFQLTRSCVMDNCSVDGGHRTRFVNRWKAQLLLNTICDVSNAPRLIDYEDELLAQNKDDNL